MKQKHIDALSVLALSVMNFTLGGVLFHFIVYPAWTKPYPPEVGIFVLFFTLVMCFFFLVGSVVFLGGMYRFVTHDRRESKRNGT